MKPSPINQKLMYKGTQHSDSQCLKEFVSADNTKFFLVISKENEDLNEVPAERAEEEKKEARPARIDEILRAATNRNPAQRPATRPLTRDEIVSLKSA